MLKESMNIITNCFLDFRGTGMYLALCFIAMLYIYLKEENKKNRNLLLYFPMVVLVVTLNPLFQKALNKIFTVHTYWRVFWMLPLGIIISYGFVKYVNSIQDKKEKIVVFTSLLVIVMMSGKFIYTSENFVKVGNLYKLPDESVEVAYLIGSDDEEYKKALVPETLVAHIRQIDSSINLAYKRNPYGYVGDKYVQNLNSGNVVGVVGLAAETGSNYVVFKKATVLVGEMEDYGFEKYKETQNYAIYKRVKK